MHTIKEDLMHTFWSCGKWMPFWADVLNMMWICTGCDFPRYPKRAPLLILYPETINTDLQLIATPLTTAELHKKMRRHPLTITIWLGETILMIKITLERNTMLNNKREQIHWEVGIFTFLEWQHKLHFFPFNLIKVLQSFAMRSSPLYL